MSIAKVFCFGEILLHYAPPMNSDFIERQHMPFYLGGAELNVASALAKWDMPVKYGTAMPSHFFIRYNYRPFKRKKILIPLPYKFLVIELAAFI